MSSTICSCAAHGLEFVSSERPLAALGATTGRSSSHEDAARTATGLRGWSARDAEAWPRFVASVAAIGRVIGTLYASTPPPIDEPGGRDLWSLLRTLRAFRALDKADAYRLLRWGPMAVADLVGESFEHERLRAAVAADGIFGTRFGPWSAGSGLAPPAARRQRSRRRAAHAWFARGGPGAIAAALERAVAQGRRRDPHQRGGRADSRATTSARAASCSPTAPRFAPAR